MEDKGEFASLDEMAGRVPQDASALTMAETIRALLSEESSLGVSDVQIVGTPVRLVPGRALLFAATDYEGVEFDVFVQARR